MDEGTGAAAGRGDMPDGDASRDRAAAAERLKALEASAAELEDRWRRALAESDNARKRHARELSHEAEAERRRICLAWLPIVDNLELALEHAKDDPASIIVGVRAVRDQAVALLASLGYPRDDETGIAFDPLRHEAAAVVEDPEVPPGTVVRVLRPGYGEPPDRQLRPAAVAVSRKQE
jgi:molecular chaperone GrpE